MRWQSYVELRDVSNVIPFRWSAMGLATLTYFLLGIATNWSHDLLFFPHTSIQNGLDDCDFEPCRAYISQGWALAGNAFGIAMIAIRGGAAIIIYVLLFERGRINTLLLLLLPAALALLALANWPHEFYHGLRVTVFICCGFLAVSAWRKGFKLVPVPFALLAIVFNPLLELHLSRSLWLAIDVATAVILCAFAVAYFRTFSPSRVA